EFYANAVLTEEEKADQYPYQSYVRGVEINFSAAKIKEVLKLRSNTPDAMIDYQSRDDVRAENIIADNLAIIAESVDGKNNLIFPSTIYRLCKAAGVPRNDFKGDKPISIDKPITAGMITRVRGRYSQHDQMLQAEDGKNEQHDHDQEDEHEEAMMHLNSNMRIQISKDSTRNMATIWDNFNKIFLPCRFSKLNSSRTSRINKLKSTRNSAAREAYCCWALQQTNPNLAPIPPRDIPTFMNRIATQGRGLFEGALWPQPLGESSDGGKGKADA
ncbi:hypothetical protein PIB30_062327, partial [Stylosanthes scabra]|nr:hypothetical protein [Stylosanthes scabra]